jgi:ornithine cyclodeaminase/alanine dehydrogenase-like protein (mu-crystallin family)
VKMSAAGRDLLVLTRGDLTGLGISWSEIVDVLEDAFQQKAAGLVQNPPKPAVRPRADAFINAMPAYLGGSDRVGIKWVAGFEQNRSKGLPYIYGVFVLTDAETGAPLALMDGGWITEMRTAGVTGVVLRNVRDRVRTVGIVGAGVQGRRHLELLLELVPGIREVRVFDAVPEASRSLLELAGDRSGAATGSAEEALAGADLAVTMVTVPLEPKLACETTAPDALLLPVDYDDAMAAAAANEAALYVVDDLGQYGSVLEDHFDGFREPDGELAQVVTGELEVPEGGRRMFLNMGIAMDDVALGALCYDRALERGAGTSIAFP